MPTVCKNFLPAVKCSNIRSEHNAEFFSNTKSTLVANGVEHRHIFFDKSPCYFWVSACVLFLPIIIQQGRGARDSLVIMSELLLLPDYVSDREHEHYYLAGSAILVVLE